ncbi:uncharacterized protein LOC126266716 isoform X1 [Schistocerca gregaria]|uniref:uncharacterized protein LOC126266716 isoform X1 n=1 Tax=Schistocerca gregaria TaxID=7010 RepID=UPI00211E3311|nr:uncharacterized protein LOC126266716 isoform X1 [Schistocerca gregaria]
MDFGRQHLPPTCLVYFLAATAALLSKGAVSETTLYKDYTELCEIVPFDKIVETIHHYNETSADVREFLKRLQDPDITEYGDWLYQQAPLHKALSFLERHRVPGYALLSNVTSLLGWPPLQPPAAAHLRAARSVHRMAQEVRASIPPLDLFSFFSRKMRTSKDFKRFVHILRSDEFNDMVLAAMQHKGYKKLTDILEEGGMDMESFRRSLTVMFGWGPREKKKHSAGLLGKIFSSFFN